MSYSSINTFLSRRSRVLASAAVVALIASGVIGEVASGGAPARAAAVATSDLSGQAAPSFATLIDRVKPAVVSVKVTIRNAAMNSDDLSGSSSGLPPEVQQFMKQFGAPNGGMRQEPSRVMVGEGSGFFVSSDGYIVTNNHVVQSAKTVVITMDNGKSMNARVVGTDPDTDLAVVKVDEPGDYPFVSFAKTEPRVGDWAVAIGNPFGLGGTVTAGIVSAEGRDIGQGPYDRFLQIDAPINKGNSGGPTFNLKGEVIGVNTAIYSPSGGSVGLGFAVPASTAINVIETLEHGGVVSRGFLGVAIQPVTQEIADSLGLKSAEGAIIDKVTPGTPAAEAGLKAGDVVTALNGEPVKDAADLTRRIGSFKPGDKVKLSYLRDGAASSAEVALALRKSDTVAEASGAKNDAAPVLGVEVAPAGQVSGAGDKGVVVVKIDPNGAAASKGLAEGDVILEVAGKPVSNADEVKSNIAAAKHDGKKAVLLRVQTANGDRFVAIPFAAG